MPKWVIDGMVFGGALLTGAGFTLYPWPSRLISLLAMQVGIALTVTGFHIMVRRQNNGGKRDGV